MVSKRTKNMETFQEQLIRTERLAAVGELASGVGHELRKPLSVIRNCVYWLNMTLPDKADEETMNTLSLLDRQVDISNRIITDLLDFTRARPSSPAPVDLHSLVKDSLSWVVVPRNITVTTDFGSKSPQVIVDAEQVGRVFANITSNAVQAMNGGGQLKISTGTAVNHAWVKFEDTGCGISEENLKKIFEPLFTTRRRGIGLGLTISKRLIEQNNGTIEVASQTDKGTVFTVRLPQYRADTGVSS